MKISLPNLLYLNRLIESISLCMDHEITLKVHWNARLVMHFFTKIPTNFQVSDCIWMPLLSSQQMASPRMPLASSKRQKSEVPRVAEMFPTWKNSKPECPQYGSNLPIWDVTFQSVSIATVRWYLVVNIDGIRNSGYLVVNTVGSSKKRTPKKTTITTTTIAIQSGIRHRNKKRIIALYRQFFCLRLMSGIQKVLNVYTYIYIYLFSYFFIGSWITSSRL